MKWQRLAFILVCCLLLTLSCFMVAAAEDEPKVGQSVGNVKFPQPLSDEDAKYLGLGKAAEFSLKDVKGTYVLVEQFSTLCPHCMAQAPHLNKLFEVMSQDAAMKGKVKFLAVGQGDNEDKLKMWKAIHKVPFPLIPDVKSTFGDALKFHPYPITLILDNSGKILWVHIGSFESVDEVLPEIKKVVK